MGPNLGIIFVFIVSANQIFFVSGLDTKRGTFHNVKRHTELKKCADKVLKENLCVGGKVKMATGDCECLSHSWGIEQTIQAGYAYTKKVSVEENFSPPVNFNERKAYGWILPGVLREGAKVEITIASDADLSIALVDTLDEIVEYMSRYKWITAHYEPDILRDFSEFDGDSNKFLQNDNTMYQLNFTRHEKTKISYLALSDRLSVFVDDQAIFWKRITLDLTTVRQMVAMLPNVLAPPLIHSFKFIDA